MFQGWRCGVAALLLIGALVGCGGGRTPVATRSVLLITLDTTRADALGCYGRSPSVTPVLDQLAREGERFTRAQSVAPLTLPAHASMLTGLVPPRHSLRDNGLWPLPDVVPTVAEIAADEGIATAAFVSSSVLDRAFGLGDGFATYEQPGRAARSTSSRYDELTASETARAAARWLRELAPDQRFFAWVHFFDPHVPYAPPSAFAESAGGDAYLGEVAFVDHTVGELLTVLREREALDQTLVIVTADHGEALGEHGELTHGVLCYQATLHVPLLVRGPGSAAGRVRDETVSLVDIAPTVLDALGLETPRDQDGVSLLHARGHVRRGVYFECYAGYIDYGFSPLAGWLDARGKYLVSSAPELYDLQRDPSEVRNLLPAREAERARFESEIARVLALRSWPRPADAPFDAELSKAIGALGYGDVAVLEAELPSPLERSDLPSPAKRVAELQALLSATAHIDAREFEDAVRLLAPIAAENRRNALAHDMLGFALMQLQRFDEAHEVLRQRVLLGTRRAETHFNLALCLEHAGAIDAALTHLRSALALDPLYSPAAEALARLSQSR
jgi:arylsulfatase A-like enzyme